MLALFGLLLLRFRPALAGAVTLLAVFLPPLTHHSSYPLTDSWGLALEIVAFAAAILAFDRGLRWLPLWIGAIALLGFTRDSAWIPILAVGWCAFRYRSRVPVTLFASGVLAALPAVLLFKTPVRELLALLVNDLEPSSDTSWGFIAGHYPQALLELVRANVGFLRRGEWYTAAFLVGGVLALLLLVWRRPATRSIQTALMTSGAVVALLYVLAAPVFSAFRLELVFLPMAAWGVALAGELAVLRLAAPRACRAAFTRFGSRATTLTRRPQTRRTARSDLDYGALSASGGKNGITKRVPAEAGDDRAENSDLHLSPARRTPSWQRAVLATWSSWPRLSSSSRARAPRSPTRRT